MEQAFVPDLHDNVIEAVEPYSPREVKRILIRAMANAAYRQQRSSGVAIDMDDLTLPNQEEIRMGFVW